MFIALMYTYLLLLNVYIFHTLDEIMLNNEHIFHVFIHLYVLREQLKQRKFKFFCRWIIAIALSWLFLFSRPTMSYLTEVNRSDNVCVLERMCTYIILISIIFISCKERVCAIYRYQWLCTFAFMCSTEIPTCLTVKNVHVYGEIGYGERKTSCRMQKVIGSNLVFVIEIIQDLPCSLPCSEKLT